jgi:TrpR family trp operon transcriptional repressor
MSAVRTPAAARRLLLDLLSPRELRALTLRWQIVLGLSRGESQRALAKRLRVGMATITRGSRVLRQGAGGVPHFLKQLGKIKDKGH